MFEVLKPIRKYYMLTGSSNMRIAFLIALVIGWMMAPVYAKKMPSFGNEKGATASGSSQISSPKLKQEGAIDLRAVEGSLDVTAMSMAYSPDGNYLAIVDVVGTFATHITVWNLQNNKLQAHTERLSQDFGVYPYATLSWTPDGKYITFGFGGNKRPIQFWSAQTGLIATQAPASVTAMSLQFNKQGTKAIASRGGVGSQKLRIYDTTSWEFQEFDEGDMYVQQAVWAPNDKVLAFGYWKPRNMHPDDAVTLASNAADGAAQQNDVIARLIDPSGHVADQTKVLIPSEQKYIQGSNRPYRQSQMQSPMFVVSSPGGEVVALGLGYIVDGQTMDIVTYVSQDDINKHNLPNVLQPRNVAISPDGNYLYLKGEAPEESSEAARNLILDARSGKQLLWFNGGTGGIAIRPDGKQLAVGDVHLIKLFHIN